MQKAIVTSLHGVTLFAGGELTASDAKTALRRAPVLVAADGGANRAIALSLMPDAVIGDFDSISEETRGQIDPSRLHMIDEQETTDFDKALRAITAPFVIGLGCLGGRFDHSLAALNVLINHPIPCILLGGPDIVFAAPAGRMLTFDLKDGDRFSLFPLAKTKGRSSGLEWPINGLEFAPDSRIGTSNRVSGHAMQIELDAPGMLVILPRRRLDQALRGLVGSGERNG